jgi:hypothetical protein
MIKVIKGRSMVEAFCLFDMTSFICSPNGPGCSNLRCQGCNGLNTPIGL